MPANNTGTVSDFGTIGYSTDAGTAVVGFWSCQAISPVLYQKQALINRHYGEPPTAMRHLILALCIFKVEGSEVKAQLLLALAWFHGVVQERRIFMPQGWTKEYDFSVGDLR